MKKGSYKGRRVDFRCYAASCFNPHLFVGPFDARCGCGATALALLTGIAPRAIAAQNGSKHFADKFMVRFLRHKAYSVQELTLCNLSASGSEIGPEHVVLLCQMFCQKEATWGVMFNGNYFHNFEFYRLETLSLLNKPVLSAYVVGHSWWRSSRPWTLKPRASTTETQQ